jgi:SAM-dependent methyltransferase
MKVNAYDSFSAEYDRFVNWPGRLAFELPWIVERLRDLNSADPVTRVLDTACGTGMHALALAKHGYAAAGADFSQGMIARAHENAAREGISLDFRVAGFGDLERTFSGSPLFPFDALLCLGNSLPHLLSIQELKRACADFSACLSPGGLLLIQNRNYDAVIARQDRWMEPISVRDGDQERVFMRFYDFRGDGSIDFNILTLMRERTEDPWQPVVNTTRQRPVLRDELDGILKEAGFGSIGYFGSLGGESFDITQSGNLVVGAYKAG